MLVWCVARVAAAAASSAAASACRCVACVRADCHGLPVEFEIDKKLGISGRDDVLAMGIKAYNAECRAIVMRYSKEWEVAFTPTLALILP